MKSQDALLKKLETIFQETLDNPSIQLELSTTANDVAEWDSVTHLVLLHAIEQEMNIRFTLDEVMQFQNVGDICASLVSRN